LKRRLVAEIREQLRSSFGLTDSDRVWAGDFNVDDPNLDLLIHDHRDSDPEYVQGCGFDASQSPHCIWHLYGQGDLTKLKREIRRNHVLIQ
jgi:hypothetical protein